MARKLIETLTDVATERLNIVKVNYPNSYDSLIAELSKTDNIWGLTPNALSLVSLYMVEHGDSMTFEMLKIRELFNY